MNRWSDADAAEFVKRYGPQHGEDVALRVYTSRLIGQDSNLVLHGGGNTSVKTTFKNKVGESVEVLAVKGSGWDLGNIEPAGFPLVDLAHCKKLVDEDMVNELRSRMMSFKSPTPSVEALLHAHLPHKFVDHSHADAILALADQPTSALARAVFGDELGYVEYVMPGFILAKKVAEVFDANPKVKGLFLVKHGLFTFGATAKESYDLHIHYVQKAVDFIASKPLATLTPEARKPAPPLEVFAPIIRGVAYSMSNASRWVLQVRQSAEIASFIASHEVRSWSQRGTCTPDHVIRTKGWPLLLLDWPELHSPASPTHKDIKAIADYVRAQFEAFAARYRAYFTVHNEKSPLKKKELDALPRVLLIEGGFLVALDRSPKAASISLDIYEHSIKIIRHAQTIGTYAPVSEADLWDMEYWTLEQAKLGSTPSQPLDGAIVAVTGGASGIGYSTLKAFGKSGCVALLLDYKQEAIDEALAQLKKEAPSVQAAGFLCDVTKEINIQSTFRRVAQTYGGLDFFVSNAGAPWQAPIAQGTAEMAASFQLNFWAHQYGAAAATQLFLLQNEGCSVQPPLGGCLLFNTSKAAVNPGPNFGPYVVAKAATLALMKQYALEYGAQNIRANAVNADRVRTQFFSLDVIEARAKSRGLTAESYFKSNLLEQEVTSDDVAQSFLALALAFRTTAGIATVDGGNLAASLR